MRIASILGYCRHGSAYFAKNEANGGLGMWCEECRSWVTKERGYDRPWLGKDHPALSGIDLTRLPVIGRAIWRKCEGPCGRPGFCELHHVAPRKFFGDECEQWPVVWLCADCHQRWHTILTPGLCTAWDPAGHAVQLLEYLGVDRAATLTRQLILAGRARRSGPLIPPSQNGSEVA